MVNHALQAGKAWAFALPLLQCGEVKDIIVLKDKGSGQSRGCAFVSYATMEEAEKAIGMLNRSVHLPGALQPMEVSCPRY